MFLCQTEAEASNGLYKPGLGPYNMVVSEDIKIDYPDRKRGLELRATWPQKGEKLPVFVFSHGAYGSQNGYEPIISYIASHGYVVLQPTHADSLRYGGRLTSIRNPLTFRNWDERPREISYILDHLDLIGNYIPALKGVMDKEAVAVGGHSFGAHTTQLLCGMTTKRPFNFSNQKRSSFADSRPKACVMISPQGTGRIIDEESFKTIQRPSLFITGSNDNSPTNDLPYTWRLEAFRFVPPGDKYLLFIDGAWHNFGGISGAGGWADAGPENLDDVNVVRTGALAFLDAYVKNDAAAKAWLTSENLRKASKGLAQITAR